MRIQHAFFSLLAALAMTAINSLAAPVPPPEKLLSDDTLVMFTMPDWDKAMELHARSPQTKLWQDPVLKPFKDKLVAKFTKEVVEPLEKELGVKFSDYSGLIHGQLTFALTTATKENGDATVGYVLVLDARDKAADLKQRLDTLKKKWVDSGKQIKSDKIRGVDFTTLIVMSEDLRKTFEKTFPDPSEGYESLEGPKKKPKNEKMELIIGQSDSLLILGSHAKGIEKILNRQTGGGAPALEEKAGFQANYNSQFRDALSYGWVDVKALIDMSVKAAKPRTGKEAGMDPTKIMEMLGVNGLKSVCFNVKDAGNGSTVQLFVQAPAAERKGLVKMLVADAKDASPPPFVPADAYKFNRWRLDLQKTWNTLEAMLVEMNPQMAGVIKLMLDTPGKATDASFDMRKNLIGNLGDDIISYSKAPRGNTLEELGSPPSLTLLASPNAEQLATGLKSLTALMPGGGGAKLKEREFLGRKIYSLPMGAAPKGGQAKLLNFCASGGYVAFSTDAQMLEDHLRATGNPGKALREHAGLLEAAQKVGGMNNGLFGFENQAETMRAVIEALRKDDGAIANFISMTPVGGRLGMAEDTKVFKEWVDFSLLPEWSKISKYFYIVVYGFQANNDGISLTFFGPDAPGVK